MRFINNILPIILASGLIGFHTPSMGIEIGNLEVNSHLNQPFHAEIPFYLDDKEKIKRIKVNLASNEQAAEAGVYWQSAMPFLRIERIGSVIKLSSPQVMREPWLDFLLDIYDGQQHHFTHYSLTLSTQGASSSFSGQTINLKQSNSLAGRKQTVKPIKHSQLKTKQAITGSPIKLSQMADNLQPVIIPLPIQDQIPAKTVALSPKTIAAQDAQQARTEFVPPKSIADQPAPEQHLNKEVVTAGHENNHKQIQQSLDSIQQRSDQLQQQINTVQNQQLQMLELNQAQTNIVTYLGYAAIGSLILGLINMVVIAIRLKQPTPKSTPIRRHESITRVPVVNEKPKTQSLIDDEIENDDLVYTTSKPVTKEEPLLDLAAAFTETDSTPTEQSSSLEQAPSEAETKETDISLEEEFDFDFTTQSEDPNFDELLQDTLESLSINSDETIKKTKSTRKKKPADAGS